MLISIVKYYVLLQAASDTAKLCAASDDYFILPFSSDYGNYLKGISDETFIECKKYI